MTVEIALSGCPFCGVVPQAFKMVPKGWTVKIDHAVDCAIGQLTGVTVPSLGRFAMRWNARARI